MSKTEVILTHNVIGLGAESDHVKVAAGYARNYLLPQGLAIPLTAANKRRLEVLRQRRGERESRELTTMTELAQALSKLTLVIHVKTGDDGKLFGSVTSGTVADELKHQFDASVDKRKIHLPHPIKNVGEHEVELRLHQQVQTTLKVRVESTTPAPQPVEAPAAEAKEPREHRESRGREGRRGAPRSEEAPKTEGRPEGRPERRPRAPKAPPA
jgi:large subunit ribosomal protein L9